MQQYLNGCYGRPAAADAVAAAAAAEIAAVAETAGSYPPAEKETVVAACHQQCPFSD